jgi:hypothetical protein
VTRIASWMISLRHERTSMYSSNSLVKGNSIFPPKKHGRADERARGGAAWKKTKRRTPQLYVPTIRRSWLTALQIVATAEACDGMAMAAVKCRVLVTKAVAVQAVVAKCRRGQCGVIVQPP